MNYRSINFKGVVFCLLVLGAQLFVLPRSVFACGVNMAPTVPVFKIRFSPESLVAPLGDVTPGNAGDTCVAALGTDPHLSEISDWYSNMTMQIGVVDQRARSFTPIDLQFSENINTSRGFLSGGNGITPSLTGEWKGYSARVPENLVVPDLVGDEYYALRFNSVPEFDIPDQTLVQAASGQGFSDGSPMFDGPHPAEYSGVAQLNQDRPIGFAGNEVTGLQANATALNFDLNGTSFRSGPVNIARGAGPGPISIIDAATGDASYQWDARVSFDSNDSNFNNILLGGNPNATIPATLIGPGTASPAAQSDDLSVIAIDVGTAQFPGQPSIPPIIIINVNKIRSQTQADEIPIGEEFDAVFEDLTSAEIVAIRPTLLSSLNEAVSQLAEINPSGASLFTAAVLDDAVDFYLNNPTTELAVGIPDLSGGGLSYTLLGSELTGSASFKTYRPADANGDNEVTILSDGTALVENLGQTDTDWRQADFNFDNMTTILGDGAILIENLSANTGLAVSLAPPLEGTAQATYDPSTGEVFIEATGQLILGLLSAAGNLITGGDDLGGTIDETLLGNEIGWLDFGGFDGLLEPGSIVAIGTDIEDLTFVYQNLGESLQTGTITLVPEPTTLVSLLLGGVVLSRRRRLNFAQLRHQPVG